VLEIGKERIGKECLCAAKTQLGLAHRTVQWWVRQASSGKLAALGKTSVAYGYNLPDYQVVHQTAR
jgi:hypothetical protein